VAEVAALIVVVKVMPQALAVTVVVVMAVDTQATVAQ
jgi:hypothetical protein